MTKRKFNKLSEKWKQMYKKGNEYSSKYSGNSKKEKKNPYWKKWAKYGRRLFKEENKIWAKKFTKEILEKPLPYSGGWWIFQALFLLIEREFTYWNNGYNVLSAEPYQQERIDSVSNAMFIVENLKGMWDDMDNEIPNENEKKLIEQLITILSNDVHNWYD